MSMHRTLEPVRISKPHSVAVSAAGNRPDHAPSKVHNKFDLKPKAGHQHATLTTLTAPGKSRYTNLNLRTSEDRLSKHGDYYHTYGGDQENQERRLKLKIGIGNAAGTHGLGSLRHSTHARNDFGALPIAHLPGDNQIMKSCDLTNEGSKLKDWMTKLKPGKAQAMASHHSKTNSVIVGANNADLLASLGHDQVRLQDSVNIRRSIQNGAMVLEPSSSQPVTAPRKLPGLKRRYEDYGKVDILAKNYNPVDEHLFGGKPLREEFKRDF